MVIPGLMQCWTYWLCVPKMMQHSAFFKIKLTEAVLLKSDWLYFLTNMPIKRNYLSILVWFNFGATWLVSCSFGHFNILQTDYLGLCVLYNKNWMRFIQHAFYTTRTLRAISADNIFNDIFLIFPRKQNFPFHANCLY